MVCSNFHSTRVCKLCLFQFAQFIVPYLKGGSITKARLSNTLLGKELYRAGLTQEAFAEKVGISARYVRVLCTRDVNVSIAVYYEILKVLNLPANSLLVYVDETHKKITLPAREGKKHDHKKKRSASALHQSSQS